VCWAAIPTKYKDEHAIRPAIKSEIRGHYTQFTRRQKSFG
jgi:hypothetical protein